MSNTVNIIVIIASIKLFHILQLQYDVEYFIAKICYTDKYEYIFKVIYTLDIYRSVSKWQIIYINVTVYDDLSSRLSMKVSNCLQ